MFEKFLNILFILIPFIDGAFSLDLSPVDFRLTYIIYLLYFCIYIKTVLNKEFVNIISKSRYIIAIFSVIILSSVYNIYLGNNTPMLFAKQVLINTFIGFTTFLFFFKNKDRLEYIVDLYIKISVVVAVFGILQEISYFIGFKYGYDFSYFKCVEQVGTSGFMYRVTSITGAEPSCISYALALAFFISLDCIINNNKTIVNLKQATVIIVCYFLTYSLIAYVGIVISLFLILVNSFIRKGIQEYIGIIFRTILFLLAFSCFFVAGNNGLVMRITDTINVNKIESVDAESVVKQNTNKIEETDVKKKSVNLSTYSLVLHARIAYKNFKEHLLFGSGFGSHFIATEKYSGLFHYDKRKPLLHKGDGASLFLRTMSEMGLFGLAVLFFFIFYFRIWKFNYLENMNFFVIINNACLVYILLRCIRSGSYYSDGFFIFAFLYFYSNKYFENRNNDTLNYRR